MWSIPYEILMRLKGPKLAAVYFLVLFWFDEVL